MMSIYTKTVLLLLILFSCTYSRYENWNDRIALECHQRYSTDNGYNTDEPYPFCVKKIKVVEKFSSMEELPQWVSDSLRSCFIRTWGEAWHEYYSFEEVAKLHIEGDTSMDYGYRFWLSYMNGDSSRYVLMGYGLSMIYETGTLESVEIPTLSYQADLKQSAPLSILQVWSIVKEKEYLGKKSKLKRIEHKSNGNGIWAIIYEKRVSLFRRSFGILFVDPFTGEVLEHRKA